MHTFFSLDAASNKQIAGVVSMVSKTKNTVLQQLRIARDQLHEKVTQTPLTDGLAQRLKVPIPSLSFRAWLEVQRYPSRYYWQDRSRNTEMAGLGEADIIAPEGADFVAAALKQIRERLPEHSSAARYYGGFRFYFDHNKNPRWHNFKTCRFILPLVELFRDHAECHLACTLYDEADRTKALSILRELSFDASPASQPLADFRKGRDIPDFVEWNRLVETLLHDMKRCELEKVVLARESLFHAQDKINPISLLRQLAHYNERAYLFCFQPAQDRAFLGASPERLYHRHGMKLSSEALAGTRRRGVDQPEDDALEQSLLEDDKERREHRIVAEAITQVLRPLSESVTAASKPTVVKLSYCQHLYTPIKAQLRRSVQDENLLDALHPTPAVGGKPTDKAMHWVLDNEPIERGIYASPVGWVSRESAEFCVGIRSALVKDNNLSLFAGAGIVPGSEPSEEWKELEAKMSQFTRIIMKDQIHESA
ncbi:MAG: isochorismate synthase [Candidatus Hydrogenedentes bacterium]|jgi:menaquinone-specific isochorismate synthase|nr:isochorismate synthase [Candidatus Hydrogenedentota bacterium]